MTIETFKQILFIVPHFYIYRWEKSEIDYSLIIDLPDDINERINVILLLFRNHLRKTLILLLYKLKITVHFREKYLSIF